jgi:hypothetical protein
MTKVNKKRIREKQLKVAKNFNTWAQLLLLKTANKRKKSQQRLKQLVVDLCSLARLRSVVVPLLSKQVQTSNMTLVSNTKLLALPKMLKKVNRIRKLIRQPVKQRSERTRETFMETRLGSERIMLL